VVDPDHCNGCTRCLADCPYAAITMAPHPDGRGRIAVVANDLCAGCGICAGACPSSTPFRSGERLATGIDLPQAPVDELREAMERMLGRARAAGEAPIVVFGCRHGARGLSGARTPVIELNLQCAGMLPPTFVEFALRGGAAGVMVAPCPPDDCEFRSGAQWVFDRIEGQREPRLRAAVERRRVRVMAAAREEGSRLAQAVDTFAAELARASSEPAAAGGGNRGIG
jgi:coenzyme F420-reducing hydrogenase delta subunit/NAD-dependent dihydropyrimidine dehydrogenase PreA subunit